MDANVIHTAFFVQEARVVCNFGHQYISDRLW